MGKKVSLVIPVLNEEKYIGRMLASVEAQDYPKHLVEMICVDGMSTDQTRKLIEESDLNQQMDIRLLDNPKRFIPHALNIGIQASSGEYIIRLDAHSEYYPDYISKCVQTLNEVDADNVGGLVLTESDGYVGEAIALVLSSRFGVGNAKFRIGGGAGYTQTVPYGAFRRETFEKYGMFDERFLRNEDNEFNYRIRKNGGKIYLNPEIKIIYHNRDSVSNFVKMAMANGKGNIYTFFHCPGAMSFRHLIPFLFVLSLIGLFLGAFLPGVAGKLFKCLLEVEIVLYLGLDLVFSCWQAFRKGIKYLAVLPFLFPVFHISYGMGSFAEVIRSIVGEEKNG